MVKDPADRAKSSRFGANYVNVKQTPALQSGLGAGGMLNRDFSRSSGFRVHDAFNQLAGSSASKAQQHLLRFTKDKRPVSSHAMVARKNGPLGARGKKARPGQSAAARRPEAVQYHPDYQMTFV